MPIYEYDCPVCGRFETIQKFSDKPLKECPSCREAGKTSKVTKMVSQASFHLKGTGWYKTDYGSSGSAGSSSKSVSSDTGTTDTKTTEKKPEKKAAGKCGSNCGCH